MLTFHAKKGVETCDGLTRRDFLRVGALSAGAVGLSLGDLTQLQASGAGRGNDVNCILLFLVGGPSQLETWDPKPAAPDNVRGPFRPIRTNVPGIDISEHLPRMASMADRYAIVRSVHHKEAPIHETGHQLMQTGRLFQGGQEHPHYGSVLSAVRGSKSNGLPPFVVLPRPIGNTGVSVSHGQCAGYLGAQHEPFFLETDADGSISELHNLCTADPARLNARNDIVDAVDNVQRAYDASGREQASVFNRVFSAQAKKAFDVAAESDDVRSRYGKNTFGQSCLLARRLIEQGTQLVTVNMFDTVFNEITWDCHADGGSLPTRLDDYRDILCPMFDLAYTALLEDLKQRGMLDNTLVVAMGEFGRTPQLNPRGGRDHWPGCWSVLFAGGGIRGGQVIGASDRTASEPFDRPVTPAEIAATIYTNLGIDPRTRIQGAVNSSTPLVDANPIRELFGA